MRKDVLENIYEDLRGFSVKLNVQYGRKASQPNRSSLEEDVIDGYQSWKTYSKVMIRFCCFGK